MKLLTWEGFNTCIKKISKKTKGEKFKGVYGFPRGGLCLAVALSHSLQIPLLTQPLAGALIVDDVYETGRTIDLVRDLPEIQVYVWISKVEPIWWKAVEIHTSQDWLVFPWENFELAANDQKAFLNSRGLCNE